MATVQFVLILAVIGVWRKGYELNEEYGYEGYSDDNNNPTNELTNWLTNIWMDRHDSWNSYLDDNTFKYHDMMWKFIIDQQKKEKNPNRCRNSMSFPILGLLLDLTDRKMARSPKLYFILRDTLIIDYLQHKRNLTWLTP